MKYRLLGLFLSPAKLLLRKVADYSDSKNKNIVLYGAGEIGREFLKSNEKWKIDLIIDKNAENFEYDLEGIPVRGPKALASVNVDECFVVIASQKFINEIKPIVQDYNQQLAIISL